MSNDLIHHLQEERQQAIRLIQEWLSKQGHDRCWYYPDIFRQLAALYGIEAPTYDQVPRSEFEQGCHRFQDDEYGGN